MQTPEQPWAGVRLEHFSGYRAAMLRQQTSPNIEFAEGLDRHRGQTVAGMAAKLRALYLHCCAKRHDDMLTLPAACPMIEGNLGCGHGMDALPDGRVGAQRLLWEGVKIADVLGQEVAYQDLASPLASAATQEPADVVTQRRLELQVIDRAAIRGYKEFHGGADLHEVMAGVRLGYAPFQHWLRSAEAEHGGVLVALRDRVAEAFDAIGMYGERRHRQPGRPSHRRPRKKQF